VVGVDDERFGQAVTAVVSLAPGVTPGEDDVIAAVKEQLAGFKAPKRVVFVDVVPRAPNGKADYVVDLALGSSLPDATDQAGRSARAVRRKVGGNTPGVVAVVFNDRAESRAERRKAVRRCALLAELAEMPAAVGACSPAGEADCGDPQRTPEHYMLRLHDRVPS
jgi:AMP-binding enzyme C-terminal domain